MEIDVATDLLRDAVGDAAVVGAPGSVWADLGAGTGTFTRALAQLLGAHATIYAVDEDAAAVAALRTLSLSSHDARVVPIGANFAHLLDLPGLNSSTPLDGILLANALHFVRDAAAVLTHLVQRLRSNGRVVVVEYDRREASRWVPYPIPAAHWPVLAARAGLRDATITASRPSEYAGYLYVGAASKA